MVLFPNIISVQQNDVYLAHIFVKMEKTNCPICNGKLSTPFMAREMMLGLRHEFPYTQCIACNTIQSLDMPQSLDAYYPDYYYSFTQEVQPLQKPSLTTKIKRVLRKHFGSPHGILPQLKPIGTKLDDKILDIGCGKGKLICEMFNQGFTDVQGVDKFIPLEYDYGNGVKILKKDIAELQKNSYDLLMMHHVFEHVENPIEELGKCYELLKKDGYLMIRIPVVGKPWEIYRENWIQLDAPRHAFIYTSESMKILANKTGFDLINVVYDSMGFQFWGSELYKKDISLVNEQKKYRIAEDYFSKSEIATFETEALKLNKNKEGDMAIFYLRKKD